MKPITITSRLEVYDSFEELSQEIQDLFQQAVEARDNAYAPYSKFKVGAALLLDDGEVVIGSNQENASYPAGLCAERTALFSAAARFPGAQIRRIAISAKSLNHPVLVPVPPCGSCRQVLAEYELKQESPVEIFFMGESGKVVKAESVKDLLPLIFDSSYF